MTRYAKFTASTHYIEAAAQASINGLPNADFTLEGWFQIPDYTVSPHLFVKGYPLDGWGVYITGVDIRIEIWGDSNHRVTHDIGTALVKNQWQHIAITWDQSEGNSQVFVDGTAYGSVNDGDGQYNADDSGDNLYIGNRNTNNASRVDKVGWVRVSNSIRYSANFTPAARSAPPASDANTVRLFKVDEGSGTTITDSSTNAQNATLSGGWGSDSDVATNANFLGALQRMTVTGVTRHYDEPPASLKTADLPAAFPLMPGAELPGPVVSCLNRNKQRGLQYAIAIEAAGQGTQAQNYGQVAQLMDNLETALDALRESEGGALSDFMTYSITTGTLQEVAGNQYWAIVADITASGAPL